MLTLTSIPADVLAEVSFLVVFIVEIVWKID